MATKNQLELPSPPTFSQMMEDLEIMAGDDRLFKLFQLEQLPEDNDKETSSTTTSNSESTVEQTHTLINQFLSGLERLQRLDASLTTQSDSTNDQLEQKLRNIIEQLQLCLNKLQSNSFSSTSTSLSSDSK